MAGAESRASAVWQGGLMDGSGRVTAGSGTLSDVPVTWQARVDRGQGMTSPEELIAAAHAACFSMAFSNILAKNETPPELLNVDAVASFEQSGGGFAITTMALSVRGRVPGLDADAFRKFAEQAKDGCPVSGALKGNVDVTVEARLEG